MRSCRLKPPRVGQPVSFKRDSDVALIFALLPAPVTLSLVLQGSLNQLDQFSFAVIIENLLKMRFTVSCAAHTAPNTINTSDPTNMPGLLIGPRRCVSPAITLPSKPNSDNQGMRRSVTGEKCVSSWCMDRCSTWGIHQCVDLPSTM